MKRFNFVLFAIVFITAVGYCGVEKPVVKKTVNIKPMRSQVLPINETQQKEFLGWQHVYGHSDTTQIYYNLTALLRMGNRQGKIINAQSNVIGSIISKDDPNSIASFVVLNRGLIKSIIKQNVGLKKQIASLTADKRLDLLIQQMEVRISELEQKIASLEKEKLQSKVDSIKPDKGEDVLVLHSLSTPMNIKPKHNKFGKNGQTVLTCGDIVIATSPSNVNDVNFIIDSCSICGMSIKTSGHSKGTQKLSEYKNIIGTMMSAK